MVNRLKLLEALFAIETTPSVPEVRFDLPFQKYPCAAPMVEPPVAVIEEAVDSALENTKGLLVVPAVAGHVIVAVPEVEPDPVMTQDVVPVRPHDRPPWPVNEPVTFSEVPVAAPIAGVTSDMLVHVPVGV